jgi:curved DNA-binding protein CbpA
LQTKDYYKILGLPPSATLKEIKSAYRRLAHQFHPDKNGNDPYAAAQFAIIKEAYEVLGNPSKKEYYLQQRWYDQVMNKKQTDTAVTPASVLKQFLALDKYVSKLDVYRMDKEGLFNYINSILSDETIKKLNAFQEEDINRSIIDSVLKSSRLLPYRLFIQVADRLVKLHNERETIDKIARQTKHSYDSMRWQKFSPAILLIVVLLICLGIYLLSRK